MSIDEELRAIVLENAKGLKELRESQKESKKEADEQMKELRESQKKTDLQMQETDRKLKSIGIQLGSISKNQGDVAEEFFVNSLSDTLMVGGIKYDMLYKNLNKRTKKNEGEFDMVLVNGSELALIETKYKAHQNDIDDFINRKYPNFKALYPEYKDYKHHLGFAAFNINEEAKQKALQNNIMILQRKGEVIETILPKTA